MLGVGSIGSTFAFQLARMGRHEVTAIARPGSSRAQQLVRDDGIINTQGERAEVHVMDELDVNIEYDLVLVTLLAHQVDAVLPSLQRSAAKWIQFMFNNFNPERLRDAIGAERCSFGMPFLQATLDPDGKLDAKIGAAGQRSKMSSRKWVKVFSEAGLPADFEADMLLWLRCHAPLGAAFESVCVAGVRRGNGASWQEAFTIARGLQESFTLIQRLGFPIYPSGKRLLHASPVAAVAGLLWSMSRIRSFRELLATGINECRALVDVLVVSAAQIQPPVSVKTILGMKPTQ